jgi:hypothetical protein
LRVWRVTQAEWPWFRLHLKTFQKLTFSQLVVVPAYPTPVLLSAPRFLPAPKFGKLSSFR